jgi:hypothetical protein
MRNLPHEWQSCRTARSGLMLLVPEDFLFSGGTQKMAKYYGST